MKNGIRLCTVAPDDKLFWGKCRDALLDTAGGDSEEEAAVEAMLAQAGRAARPRAVFAELPVLETGESFASVGTVAGTSVTVDSPLAGEKLAGKKRVFAYIATCGPELDEWSARCSDDPLERYRAEEIKKYALELARVEMTRAVRETSGGGCFLSALNPGSLPQWPISGQRQLFDMLGDDNIRELAGVTLTGSFLMLPYKTVSGIYFESDADFHNCSLCGRLDCQSRRAPYAKTDKNSKFYRKV